jgi:hypothetical protein
MVIAIVQHTPVWVWGLLAALTSLGLWQTRDRQMSLRRITVLPLVMVVLSLSGVLGAFGPSIAALAAWAAGVAAAQVAASHLLDLRGAAWSPSTECLRVPGSWLPLTLILGLFAVKYFAGYNLAVNPALATTAGFAGLCSLAYGLVSGLFMARALSLRSLATAPQAQAT